LIITAGGVSPATVPAGFRGTGGTLNADNGTVMFTGMHVSAIVSVGTGLVRFYNFTDALSSGNYPNGMVINGTLTATGTFVWIGSANPIYGSIEAQGDVDDENHGGIGNPYLTLDGAADQTIEDLSGGGVGSSARSPSKRPGAPCPWPATRSTSPASP
jgi:hypothetical protein